MFSSYHFSVDNSEVNVYIYMVGIETFNGQCGIGASVAFEIKQHVGCLVFSADMVDEIEHRLRLS